jgi:GAF domain-containing protein
MKRKVILQYTLFGVLFGFLFPLLATIWGVYALALPFNMASIMIVQNSNPLYWMIDSAPIFLGLFALYGGIRHAQALELNQELESGLQERSEMVSQLEGLRSDLEKVVEKQVVQLKASAKVAREAAAIHDLQEMLNRTATLISDQFGFYHTGIFLVDVNSEFALLYATNSEGGQRMLEQGHRLKVGEEGIVGFVAAHNTPRVAMDVGDDAVFFNNPDLPETHSEVALPLSVRGRVIGVLDVQSTQAANFTEGDIEILRLLADQVALAIDNARLLSQSQASLEQIEALYNQQVQSSWQKRLAGQSVIYTYNPLWIKTATQIDPIYLQEDSHLLKVPISVRGQLLGRLVLRRDTDQPAWSDAENQLLVESADQIALALENARLVEEAHTRSNQLQFLHELTSAAAAQDNLEKLLADVVQRIGARFDVQHCGVLLFNLELGCGIFAADAAQPNDAASSSFTKANLPADLFKFSHEMFGSEQSIAIYNVLEDPRAAVMHEVLQQRGTNTWVVAPLVSRGAVLGLVGLEEADPGRRFDADELLLLEQVCRQVASAIDVTTIVEKTRQQAEREHQQAEIVSKVRRTTDMEMILKTAIQELSETLHVRRGSIQLRGNDGN